MKVFRIIISYTEPVMGEVVMHAATEEEAINALRASLPGHTVEIEEIEELDDIPDEYIDELPTANSTIN